MSQFDKFYRICAIFNLIVEVEVVVKIFSVTISDYANFFQVSSYVKKAKVKQVMADLALSPIGNRQVEHLSQSEYRRLTIGVQLVRDPVVLLLDEPTWDLDPLNTYFVVSILANHAKKYNRIVLLTMEKPRSDIFPFLDR